MLLITWTKILWSFIAYADEDQLLWRPDGLPEAKVADFLREAALLHSDGAKMGGDLDCSRVRDNEQVRSQSVMVFQAAIIISPQYLPLQ